MVESSQNINADTKKIKETFLNEIVDIEIGLSEKQIDERIKYKMINGDINTKTKSIKEIFIKNIFTLFNILNVALAVLVILVGAFKNALFILLIITNTFISLFQELKSKKTIDKLSLLSAPKAKVLRNKLVNSISLNDLLLSDIVLLESGNQVCADSIVVNGEFEVNESLLTGESDAVIKKSGDILLSGSFIQSGCGKARVIKIGKENYAAKITAGAKYVKKVNSEIMKSINAILKIMTYVVLILALLLTIKNLVFGNLPIKDLVVTTVAQIIGMIPEGLVLLTTLVFASGVIRLARHKTLVQDLYCIETLARVNVLCLDKTGTITTGGMQVDNLVPINIKSDEFSLIMDALASNLSDNNPTMIAIKKKFEKKIDWKMTESLAFNSARKYSAVSFENKGTFYLGAGEFLLKENYYLIENEVNKHSSLGKRVLTLAHSNSNIGSSVEDLKILGLVLLSDTIRGEAPKTLKYFKEQGVDILVLSGDNPITVSKIAIAAGLKDGEKYVDASTLKTDEDIKNALEKYKIFGRVTPEQKLLFIKLLKKKGNTVAMTGDGVNDVLALKEADCSVAMASGSDAARCVSSLVLLDNNFASLPEIVAEGRRSINNLQRSSSLFLIKTIYATIFAILFIFLPYKYPYAPIQLTLIGTFLTGIPSVLLSLEPNKDRLKGKFLTNSITTALPGAIYIVFSTILFLILTSSSGVLPLTFKQQTTIATFILGVLIWFVLIQNCKPYSKLRAFIIIVSGLIFAFVNLTPYLNVPVFSMIANLFDLVKIPFNSFYIIIPIILLAVPFLIHARRYFYKSHATDKLIDKMLKFVERHEKPEIKR